jgi:hypothetical protein
MRGPLQKASCENPIPPSEGKWEKRNLERGRRYRVNKAFTDSDGDNHQIGEEWVFVSSMYSKFDELLTLCIQDSTGQYWQLPLFWKKEKQGEIIEHIDKFVEVV